MGVMNNPDYQPYFDALAADLAPLSGQYNERCNLPRNTPIEAPATRRWFVEWAFENRYDWALAAVMRLCQKLDGVEKAGENPYLDPAYKERLKAEGYE
jgi:hypothetical protein